MTKWFLVILTIFLFVSVPVFAGTIEDIKRQLSVGDTNSSKEGQEKYVILDKSAIADLDISVKGKDFLSLYKTSWKVSIFEEFTFYYRNMSNIRKLASIVEEAYLVIRNDLQTESSEDLFSAGDISIFVIDDKLKWDKFTEEIEVSRCAVGVASGKEIYLYLNWGDMNYRSFSLRLLVHELTHIILKRLYPAGLPVWLNEGIAEYEEYKAGEYIKQARSLQHREADRKSFFKIDELVSLQSIPCNRLYSFYLQSRRLVAFLYEKQDKVKFLEFVKLTSQGYPFKNAVTEVYGDDYPSYRIFKIKAAKYK